MLIALIDEKIHQFCIDVVVIFSNFSSNPQLSPSTSFLRVHVLSLLNYQIN